jgi:hypothetical protein
VTGTVDWSVVYLIVGCTAAVAVGVSTVIIFLYRVRDELRNEIRDSRHKIRGELQHEASVNDAHDEARRREISDLRNFLQKDSSEWRERVARLETWRKNGNH